MYAIIEESGGQRKVSSGDEFVIDLYEAGDVEVGRGITFDKVLVVGGSDGKASRVGQPYVAGASVSVEVIESVVLGEKLTIQYFQPKKGSRRRTGHRQRFTKVKVTAING